MFCRGHRERGIPILCNLEFKEKSFPLFATRIFCFKPPSSTFSYRPYQSRRRRVLAKDLRWPLTLLPERSDNSSVAMYRGSYWQVFLAILVFLRFSFVPGYVFSLYCRPSRGSCPRCSSLLGLASS
jgi:hypothetical protein